MFFLRKKVRPSVPEEILNKYFSEFGFQSPICNAPFTSLYFSPNGDVSACCENKSYYSYGHYPEDAIKKMIGSNRRKIHQEYLMKNNFSLGCKVCEENLRSENFSGLLLNGLRNFKIHNFVTRIDFELSHLCNFECIMCHRDKNLVDTVYDDRFVSEIHPYLLNIKYATFIGGEPCLIPLYYKIWDIITAENPNCEISIITNGSILNEKVKKLARNPRSYIVISLDSINDETYSAIRVGGELKKTLANFAFFNECMQEKNQTMQISVCPMRQNWEEMPQLVEFANLNNCSVFFNHVYHPQHLSLKYLSPAELGNIVESYKKSHAKLQTGTPLFMKNRDMFEGLIKLLVNWQSEAVMTQNEHHHVL